MTMKIASAPCCWGVDDVNNPHLPPWQRVLDEASQAGYTGIELGPYGYLPLDVELVGSTLQQHQLSIVAGTIFDDLVSASNLPNLLKQTHDICSLITRLPPPAIIAGQKFAAPFLVVIDWGHPERDIQAGHGNRAPRLPRQQWQDMMDHIKQIATLAWKEYKVRTVIHPHAGGYIEFADEIIQTLANIPYSTAGLCLDTGHLYYSGMDPEQWLRTHAARLDYVHFKDINLDTYQKVMQQEITFFDACAQGVMCPIGTGIIDYARIKQTLVDIDYHGYITIEQERDPRHADTSLRDVAASRAFLNSVGFH